MKRTWIILLVCLAALFCLPVSAAEGAAPASSTNLADLTLTDTRGANYIMSYRGGQGIQTSYLYENESGGLTLVQYRRKTLIAAEFDKDLNFLQMWQQPLDSVSTWGAFCTDGTYNFAVFAADKTTLQINRYTMDWELDRSITFVPGNTTSIMGHGCDVAAHNGTLTIATTHYMTDGHQANLLLQFNTHLSLLRECSGVYNYDGYSSHAYFPEVAYAGGYIYTAEMGDSIPSAGISLTKHNTLGSASHRTYLGSRKWQDLGALGNLIPAAEGGVLAAYAHANYVLNQPSIEQADAYLAYFDGASNSKTIQRVTYTGGVGTPYVAPLDEYNGYILWNPEPRADLDSDMLYYAPYTLSGGSPVVGRVQTAPHTWLTDCEPIAWQGTTIWFTFEKELIFHQLDAAGNLTRTVLHLFETVPEKLPTCTTEGWTEGQRCTACGLQLTEPLPMLPHTVVEDPAIAPTCLESGRTAGSHCDVCGETLSGGEVIPAAGHNWVAAEAAAPTCTEPGSEAGICCDVCGTILLGCGTIPAAGHRPEVPEIEDCTQDLHCTVCGEIVKQAANRQHDFERIDLQLPDCTTDGWELYRCTACEVQRTETLPAAGHQQEVPEIEDCTQDLHCTVCGEIVKQAANRQHDFKRIDLQLPDCTTDGWELYHCTACQVEKTEVTQAQGHTWIMSHCTDCDLDCAEAVRTGDTVTVTMAEGADGAVMLLATYDAAGKFLSLTRWDWDLMAENPASMTVPLGENCGSYCLMFFFYEPFTSPSRPALKG